MDVQKRSRVTIYKRGGVPNVVVSSFRREVEGWCRGGKGKRANAIRSGQWDLVSPHSRSQPAASREGRGETVKAGKN